MKIININKDSLKKLGDDVCVIMGNFDGIHLGHQQLIKEAKENFNKCALLTFEPHPRKVINNLENFLQITPIDKKIEFLEGIQVDYLLLMEFSNYFKNISKEKFITFLKQMNIKNVICGYDYRFALDKSGNVEDLKQNFNVRVIRKCEVDNIRISSTYIKKLIESGSMEEVFRYLGRYYSIKGKVIKGNQVGKILGFPTANISQTGYVIPKKGVYLSKVKVNGNYYNSLTNVGRNPTLNKSKNIIIETYIIDFNQDIYNQSLEVFFCKYLREEKKFNNKEELIKQLNIDLKTAREYIGKNN